MIVAGRLRHKVIALRRTDATDVYGGLEDTWRELASVRASIEPLTGAERETTTHEVANQSVRIRMRAHPKLCDLSPRDRLHHCKDSGVTIYDITAVLVPWEVGRELIVMAKRWESDNSG